ncbi:MAG: hypothetical protein R2726_21700 [Acidimicrobiales bacterium]
MTRAATTDRRSVRTAASFAAVATALYLLVCVAILVSQRGHAEWFTKFGQSNPAVVDEARRLLGRDVVVAFIDAHDGTCYWSIARDPLLLQPDDLATHLDRPRYRAQRVFYSLLASPFRLGGEEALFFGLVIANLGGVFVGSYLAVRLAQEIVAPTRAGLAFAANPAVIAGVMLDLGDVWAIAALLGTVLNVHRGRWGRAAAFAVVAALSREVMLAGIVALAIGAVGRPVRDRVRLATVPTGVTVAWWIYVGTRFRWVDMRVDEFTLVPFGGWHSRTSAVGRPMSDGATSSSLSSAWWWPSVSSSSGCDVAHSSSGQ